jgi:hypothetical protein
MDLLQGSDGQGKGKGPLRRIEEGEHGLWSHRPDALA